MCQPGFKENFSPSVRVPSVAALACEMSCTLSRGVEKTSLAAACATLGRRQSKASNRKRMAGISHGPRRNGIRTR